MYLTKINLDQKKKETAKAFSDHGRFHSLIEGCFSGERQHPLWRLESDAHSYSLLILSKDIPNLTPLESAVGRGDGRTIAYDQYLDSACRNENVLRFRIAANPIVTVNHARVPLNIKRTARYPYCAEDWLRNQLEKGGAEVLESTMTDNRTISIKGGTGQLFKVTFEGTLKVIDQNKFRCLLEKGIGHGKAYGCGFLSVIA